MSSGRLSPGNGLHTTSAALSIAVAQVTENSSSASCLDAGAASDCATSRR